MAMNEIGERSLPGNKGIKKAVMQQCLWEEGMEVPAENEPAFRKKLELQCEEYRLKIMRAERKMAKLEGQYKCCLNLISVARELPNRLDTLQGGIFALTAWEKEWLDISGQIATGQLSECGTGARQLLRVEMDTLQFKLSKLEQLLAELPNGNA